MQSVGIAMLFTYGKQYQACWMCFGKRVTLLLGAWGEEVFSKRGMRVQGMKLFSIELEQMGTLQLHSDKVRAHVVLTTVQSWIIVWRVINR